MFETSGDFFSVQLMNSARRSEKSQVLCSESCFLSFAQNHVGVTSLARGGRVCQNVVERVRLTALPSHGRL